MSELVNKSCVSDYFGCNVFNDHTMRDRLPKDIFKSLKKTRELGESLAPDVAEVVANAMKDWAIEKGATHYTHWFQPMTGITAEKHDAFISPTGDGKIIMEFSGKELIKGEPDASSFPSGGLRATFEARGYTAWDPTAYAFIKDNSLYIPSVFLSYSGEVLDKKTPLLKSMSAVNKQALRILRLFGNTTVKHVTTTVGAEQEYFLVDKELFNKRQDLVFTGRTVFGAMPPKGQEKEDHYFGALKDKVSNYMKELDVELWKLGIPSKTKHNEAAPAQHELAPIFENSNLATDHNQLTMDVMQKVAIRNGLVCLLHEKPFAGVNGSGKHNNWSLTTDEGENLFNPGKAPQNNIQFITFLCAVIKAVDEYVSLLRLSVASAGNEHRLGGHEAPPAIVSIFLGDELTNILESIESGTVGEVIKGTKVKLGVNSLPSFTKDTTDRNRTSPFAFTGNKFEFRMLGSSSSISCTNIMLNTVYAEILEQFADRLEGKENFEEELHLLLAQTIKEHKRIIFNGNNYSDEWVQEAERRGLQNVKNTVDALRYYIDEKNLKVLTKHKVLNEAEVRSRHDILIEEYSKTLNIEATVMAEMTRKMIFPTAMAYQKELCDLIISKSQLNLNISVERQIVETIVDLTKKIEMQLLKLEELIVEIKAIKDVIKSASSYSEKIVPVMQQLRQYVDKLEFYIPKDKWPMPIYSELMYNI